MLRSRLARALALCAGFGLLSLGVFFPALPGEFVSDDINAIVLNERVAGPFDPVEIFATPSWWGSGRGDAPGYRPLTTLTFALNYAAAGLYRVPYHLTNIVLHALVSAAVVALALRLGMGALGALLAGTMFCLLPIHSEAVCWVVGRAELLAAGATITALVLVLDYLGGGTGAMRLGAAALLWAAGLFSKENAVCLLPLPALAAWLLYPPGERPIRRAALSTAVLAVGFAAYLAARAAAVGLPGPERPDLLDNPLSVLDPWPRLLGALSVLGRYLKLVLWPHPLSVDYSYDALGIGPGFAGDAYTLLGAGGLAFLAAWGWRLRKQYPQVTFALLLAAAAYAVVANFPLTIGTIMAERLFYLPSAGLCIAAAARLERPLRERRRLAAAAMLALTALWGAADLARARQWRSAISLFEASVAAYPRSARAHMELGTAYGAAGRTNEGRRAYETALSLKPDYAAAWYNLGNLEARAGRFEEAAAAYKKALEYVPALAPAWYNLGLTLRVLGRLDEARRALREGTKRAPHDYALWQQLGDLLVAAGDYEGAIDAYTRALREGAPMGARLARATALEWLHGCQAALPDYRAVLEADPSNQLARSRLEACGQQSLRAR